MDLKDLLKLGAVIRLPYKESFDEFFEKFSSYLNNIGILIRNVLKENPDLEPDYSEEDLEKLKKLVEEKKKELEKKQ